ncbi:DUF3581 family protein [Marinobacter similis]
MFLDRFHSIQQGRIHITALQASRFAKEIAGDFNPIHDPDARRFCVPGDLLFAVVVSHFGLSANMTFQFKSLLGDGVALEFREPEEGRIELCDANGKVYLEVTRSGASTRDETTIENFTRCYVSASGKNFPHTLQPLMESNGVMFNPDRPMVMYESMSLALDRWMPASRNWNCTTRNSPPTASVAMSPWSTGYCPITNRSARLPSAWCSVACDPIAQTPWPAYWKSFTGSKPAAWITAATCKPYQSCE